jgi:hypothetical protein
MNAMDEISVYALLLHFGLVVFADTAVIGTIFRFVVSFGFELTGAFLRGVHAGGIFSCMTLVSILAPASLPDCVRSNKGVGKGAKPLRERLGPAVQPCGYISDDAVYRLKTVFLFMSASLFLQLGWLICMVVELYAPSTVYLPWSNSIYGHWHCLGAMTLFLALRHVPEFPPGTLRFSVYGWFTALLLFWIAPKTSAVMAFSANWFLLITGWVAGGFLIVLGLSTTIRTSPLAGSSLWLALSLLPMVAALPYDNTDARWGVVEAWLAAPPGLGAPEIQVFLTALGLADMDINDLVPLAPDPPNSAADMDNLLTVVLGLTGGVLFRCRRVIFRKLNLARAGSAGAPGAPGASLPPRPEPISRVAAAVAAGSDPVEAAAAGLRNAPAMEGKSKFTVRMMKGGPHTVKGGEWGTEELQLEASDDFFLKISGSAVNKPKNQDEMEEFVGEAIEACQDVEPPFLGALAAITSAWSQAKQLGEEQSWRFFQELVVKGNYRLDTNLIDKLFSKYMLKVARGPSAADSKMSKKLSGDMSTAHKRLDVMQHKLDSVNALYLQTVNETRAEMKLAPLTRLPGSRKPARRRVKQDSDAESSD